MSYSFVKRSEIGGEKNFLLLIIFVLTPFYNVTLISGNSTTASFTPLSHTITIEMTKYSSYNYTSEIDVSKNFSLNASICT